MPATNTINNMLWNQAFKKGRKTDSSFIRRFGAVFEQSKHWPRVTIFPNMAVFLYSKMSGDLSGHIVQPLHNLYRSRLEQCLRYFYT